MSLDFGIAHPADAVHGEKSVISSFKDDFKFLSNFYPSVIYYEGKKYSSVEHAYQAAKTLDPISKELIRNAKSAGAAKKLGYSIVIRDDWENVKVDIMRTLIQKKFENPFLRPLLLATEDAELIEGNTWGDREWGMCQGEGKNLLGKILMQIRDEIRQEEKTD